MADQLTSRNAHIHTHRRATGPALVTSTMVTPRRLLSLGASALLLASIVEAYPKLLVDDKRCAVPLEVRDV